MYDSWRMFELLVIVQPNEMPEPILEPKFAKSVAFGYTTDFFKITTEKRCKSQQPKTTTEK